MPSIPAICENCDTVFPSGFAGGGGSRIYMYGNKSGPCPNCGGWGYVADGMYRTYDNLIEVFQVDNGKGLDKLFFLLTNLDNDANIDEVEEVIKSETPQYSGLIEWMREMLGKNKDFINLIPLIISLITFVQNNINSQNDVTEEFFEQLYQNQVKIVELQENHTDTQNAHLEKIDELEKELEEIKKETKEEGE